VHAGGDLQQKMAGTISAGGSASDSAVMDSSEKPKPL
jgi:hypothetical protein